MGEQLHTLTLSASLGLHSKCIDFLVLQLINSAWAPHVKDMYMNAQEHL